MACRANLWNTLLDAGKAAYMKAYGAAKARPNQAASIWHKFDVVWLQSQIIDTGQGNWVKWKCKGPPPYHLYSVLVLAALLFRCSVLLIISSVSGFGLIVFLSISI